MHDPDSPGSVIKMARPGDCLPRVRLLVENLMRAHGLDPVAHLLSEGPDSCSWHFWAGTSGSSESGRPDRVLLVLSVFLATGTGYLRLSSPIVLLPEPARRQDFYRRLLDHNSEMVSSALATFGEEVHVVSVRSVQDLDASEVEELIRCVTGYARRWREELSLEFQVRPWEMIPPPGEDPEGPRD